MSFVHICEKCRAMIKYPTQDVHSCPDCKILTASRDVLIFERRVMDDTRR